MAEMVRQLSEALNVILVYAEPQKSSEKSVVIKASV
jgi:hypothetical protein